ncbi:MAG: ABC transporter permease, partial [Betaproteobacteria bacterium]
MQASSAIAPAALALDAHAPGALRKALSRAEARRKWRAFALTLPLLVFLLLTLLVPIAALLQRGVENPEVANTLPATIEALHGWDRHEAPGPAAYAALMKDLARLPDSSDAGALARRLNSELPGARSMVMGAFRALPMGGTSESIRDQLIEKDARWGEAPFWRAIAKNGARWTPDYLLASVDLQRDALGQVERMPEEQRAFGGILLRTFHISFVVTLICLLLGYPLAWWLASLPARQANVLMILVLVPFWTSILVRVAAWIV